MMLPAPSLALLLAATSLGLAQSRGGHGGGRHGGGRFPEDLKGKKDDLENKKDQYQDNHEPYEEPYPDYYPEPYPERFPSQRYPERGAPHSNQSSQQRPGLPNASSACVQNHGSFELSFELWDTATNEVSASSGSISRGQRSCLDMSKLGSIEAGHPVVAVVRARGGISRSLPPALYSPASGGGEIATANFACKGSTDRFTCVLGTEKKSGDQPGFQAAAADEKPSSQQVRAKGVCVQDGRHQSRLRFKLWDTATGALSGWLEPPVGTFTANETRNGSSHACVEGSSITGVSTGHPLALIANPQGSAPATFRSVIYDPSATNALFICAGADTQFGCRLQSASRRLQILV